MDNFSFTTFVWDKEYLDSILFHGKHKIIHDPYIQRGFHQIDRAHFIPDKFRKLAYEDKDIDIGFGQKLHKPTTSAKLINLLSPKPRGNYLVIGAGSGYISAIIGAIAGLHGKVIAVERVLMLLEIFRKNMANYPHLNEVVEPVFKDGSQGYISSAPYDGILYTANMNENPVQVIAQLKVNSSIIVPREDNTVRVMTRLDNTNWSEKIYKDFILNDKILSGVE
jgi:protein-L-isoaspartate(D-aspartate) O-methyltransferase